MDIVGGLLGFRGFSALVSLCAACLRDRTWVYEHSDFSLLDFWSVGVIVLFIVAWIVLAALGVRVKTWFLPALCVLVLLINVGTFYFSM